MKDFGISKEVLFFKKKIFEAVFEIDVNIMINHKLKLWKWGGCNAEQFFYTVHANFLLSVRSDCFLKIRCSLNQISALSCEF